MTAAKTGTTRAKWIPARQDIIWIDCNPQAGREMRDVHPFLVLSPKAFNERTSLVLGLPMTTADKPLVIALGRRAFILPA